MQSPACLVKLLSEMSDNRDCLWLSALKMVVLSSCWSHFILGRCFQAGLSHRAMGISQLPQGPGDRGLGSSKESKCQHHLSSCQSPSSFRSDSQASAPALQSLSSEQSRSAGPGIFPFTAGDAPSSVAGLAPTQLRLWEHSRNAEAKYNRPYLVIPVL